MANITIGNSFTTGDQITATNLNLIFSGAVLAACCLDSTKAVSHGANNVSAVEAYNSP